MPDPLLPPFLHPPLGIDPAGEPNPPDLTNHSTQNAFIPPNSNSRSTNPQGAIDTPHIVNNASSSTQPFAHSTVLPSIENGDKDNVCLGNLTRARLFLLFAGAVIRSTLMQAYLIGRYDSDRIMEAWLTAGPEVDVTMARNNDRALALNSAWQHMNAAVEEARKFRPEDVPKIRKLQEMLHMSMP